MITEFLCSWYLSSDGKTTPLIPTWQDTEVLESLLKALTPVAELTDLLFGEEHITISSIIPVLHNLRSRILAEQQDDSALTKDIKRSILVEAHYCDPETMNCSALQHFWIHASRYAENPDHLKAVIEEQVIEGILYRWNRTGPRCAIMLIHACSLIRGFPIMLRGAQNEVLLYARM